MERGDATRRRAGRRVSRQLDQLDQRDRLDRLDRRTAGRRTARRTRRTRQPPERCARRTRCEWRRAGRPGPARSCARVTPDDLKHVQRSWAELCDRRESLLAELTLSFQSNPASPCDACSRAEWLLCAVEELVELLPAPSTLASRARVLGDRWPDPLTAPSFEIDGRAWMAAATRCSSMWSDTIEM